MQVGLEGSKGYLKIAKRGRGGSGRLQGDRKVARVTGRLQGGLEG